MIKSVSRHILEVSETGNSYFERAFLIVAPQYMNSDCSKIELEAENYLKSIEPPIAIKRNGNLFIRSIGFVISAIGGGLVTAAVLLR